MNYYDETSVENTADWAQPQTLEDFEEAYWAYKENQALQAGEDLESLEAEAEADDDVEF